MLVKLRGEPGKSTCFGDSSYLALKRTPIELHICSVSNKHVSMLKLQAVFNYNGVIRKAFNRVGIQQLNFIIMTFIYSFHSEEYFSELLPDMANSINALNPTQGRSVKIAACDLSGRNAKGALFYCDSAPPNNAYLGGTWRSTMFKSNSVDQACKDCLEFLNSNELTDAQKYYSRVVLTNNDSTAYCALFYEDQK